MTSTKKHNQRDLAGMLREENALYEAQRQLERMIDELDTIQLGHRIARQILDDARNRVIKSAFQLRRLQQGVSHPDRAKGGIKRAQTLSPERRSEIAKKGAEARWGVKI